MWRSTNGKDKDQVQEPHKNIQDKGKDGSSNPISHEIVILFDWTMEFFLCFIRPKNSHSKINWKANHSQFSLALEGWGGHWLEGRISKLPLGKGNKLKERSWRLTKGEGSLLGWEKEKRKEGMCGKKKIKISSYVWKVVVHERDVCTN